MLSLKTVRPKFTVPLKVVAGGTGIVRAQITEADQTQVPSYIFVHPRLIARLPPNTPLKPRHVVETPSGLRFIVGENGPSEKWEGTLWQSYRLFQVTHQLEWSRRGRTVDPITKQEREDTPTDLGTIHIAVEPTDREEDERRLATHFEKARYITNELLKADDLVGEYRVTRADTMLGVTIGTLTY